MPTRRVQRLDDDVFLIDHDFQGVPGVVASYLLSGAGELALVETGPSSSLDALLEGVREAGFDPESITHLLVTHIHLDHSGSAGVLLRRLPRARVYVHPAGAPHLADPSKLVASATRIYGDRMDELWGEIAPVPEDRLSTLSDRETLRVAGRTLRALDTPGHATHHLAFHDAGSDVVYCGDVAGVRIHGSSHVRPPTPPPELDLALWRASATRLRELRPARLRLTHFGEYADPERHLDELLSRLFFWGGWVDARLEAGDDRDEIVRDLQRRGDAEIRETTDDEALVEAYELSTSYRMTVDGFARYFRRLRG